MRTAKYTLSSLLVVCLSLLMIQCGSKEKKRDFPSATDSMIKYKAVRILTNAANPPFVSGSGTSVQGIDVDIATEVAKDLGWPDIKWVKADFSRLVEILTNGEAELIISAFPMETPMTAEQKTEVAFSTPYFESFDTIAHRKDKPEIKDVASLAGKKVGVRSGSTGLDVLKSQTALNATPQEFPTFDDGLGALNRTEVDAMIGDGTIMTYSIYQSFQNLIPLDLHLTTLHYVVVVRKEETEVMKKVNATLERLRSAGALEESRKKWLGDVMDKTAEIRKKLGEEEALKDAPKAVIIDMTKTAGANFNMERLDGYVAELVGPTQTYKSEPINTTGNRGTIRFPTPVPPGKYELRMSIFKFAKEIPIPRKASKSITFDMSIGKDITITEREK